MTVDTTSPVPRRRLRRFYRRWLPLAFTITALANTALTPFLPSVSLPVRAYADPSLTYLVHEEGVSLDLRYGFYMELADAAHGGILIVPPDSFLDVEIAEGLAGVTMVQRSYDPSALPADIAPTGPPLGLFETPIGDMPYWIVPGKADDWWLALTDQGVIVVSQEVAPVPGDQP